MRINSIIFSISFFVISACGNQIENIDQLPPDNVRLSIDSPSLLGGNAAGFMVFDIDQTDDTGEIIEAISFASQQVNIKNPEVQFDIMPDRALAYVIFIEGIGSELTACQAERQSEELRAAGLNGRCLHWGLLNVTFTDGAFEDRKVPANLNEQYVMTRGASLLTVPYLEKPGGGFEFVRGFAGIVPPARRFTSYTLTVFAMTRRLELVADDGSPGQDAAVSGVKTIEDFQNLFGASGKDLIIASDSVNFIVEGKQFKLYNQDGSFDDAFDTAGDGGILKSNLITCGGIPSRGNSPFDNPGYSPQLTWEDAPASANSFALFMMDDSSLEDANIYTTARGAGDARGGRLGNPTYEDTALNEPSQSTQSTASYSVECDFEACRHWAVFNIPIERTRLARNQDISAIQGAVVGKHLFHGAYYIQQQSLDATATYVASIGQTVTYSTNRGTLDSAFIATSNASTPLVDATKGYFGPCGPVNSGTAKNLRQYTITLVPVSADVTNWVTNAGTLSAFIQTLSLNNFLYYFSPNTSDQRRKRPGCPQSDLECGESPHPTRSEFLKQLTNTSDPDESIRHVLHSGAVTTFYHADDDCELCRFCLIGYDTVEQAVPFDGWRQYGHI